MNAIATLYGLVAIAVAVAIHGVSPQPQEQDSPWMRVAVVAMWPVVVYATLAPLIED